MKEDVSQKSYIKDVCVLVDMKANNDEVQKYVDDLYLAIKQY